MNWRQTAVDQVTNAWLGADETLRAAITNSVIEIGVQLRDDPSAKGESRSEGRRIVLTPPLGVVFRIDALTQTVLILRAWIFRQGRGADQGAE